MVRRLRLPSRGQSLTEFLVVTALLTLVFGYLIMTRLAGPGGHGGAIDNMQAKAIDRVAKD